MKKVIFLFAIALCGAVCLTSCSDDDNNAAAWYYYAMMNGPNVMADGKGQDECNEDANNYKICRKITFVLVDNKNCTDIQ